MRAHWTRVVEGGQRGTKHAGNTAAAILFSFARSCCGGDDGKRLYRASNLPLTRLPLKRPAAQRYKSESIESKKYSLLRVIRRYRSASRQLRALLDEGKRNMPRYIRLRKTIQVARYYD